MLTKPSQAKPSQAKPSQAKPSQAKPTSEPKSQDCKKKNSKPTDSKPTNKKPTDKKPTDKKPTNTWKYDEIMDFKEGVAEVSKDGKYGYINKQGKEIIPVQYDIQHYDDILADLIDGYLYDQQHSVNGIITLNKGEKQIYFLNKQGKEVIPLQYDSVKNSSKNLYQVIMNGKLGFINKQGKEVIPIKYDETKQFKGGLAGVGKGTRKNGKFIGKWGFINKQGQEVIPLQYDSVSDFFREGLAYVKKDGKWGFANEQGKEILPTQYDKIWIFKNGLAKVGKGGNDTHGIFNGKLGMVNNSSLTNI